MIKKTGLAVSALLLTLIASIVLQAVPTQAASAADWRAGNIIDDSIFYNGNDMSAAEIQAFLNARNPNCDTWGTRPSEYGGGTRAQYGASRGYPAPYTCLKDYSMSVPGYAADAYCGAISGGTKSAAQIIKDVASACGIGSKVLIVLLQKEQSLITDEWPWPTQYQKATGFACPDTAPCDAQYAGYFNQVYRAGRQYKVYRANPNSYRYKARQNNVVLFNPNAACGSSNVYIENDATAGLYIYTPYQPNQAALNNLYGTGDGCSAYGNRNFWRMYTDWFGSTRGVPYAWQYVTQYAYTDSSKTTQINMNNGVAAGQRVYLGVQARNTGNTTWTNSGNNPVRLGTSNPQNRSSAFCDTSWLSCGRPVNLQQASVPPGQVGTFEFWYKAPANAGSYNEYFNLLAEGITWMNDPGLYFTTVVQQPTYTWQLIDQYAYTGSNKTAGVDLQNLVPNQRVYIGFTARNTGSAVWTNSGNNPVRVGTNNPLGRSSPFCDATWIGCGRPANLIQSSVAPGQTGNFEFWYKAPANIGTYSEGFRPLAEGITWMNDIGLNFATQVKPGALPAPEIVDRLSPNQQIGVGESLQSGDGRFRLVLQGDGNLVIYSPNRAIWSTNTVSSGATRLVMQGDGNLVLYRSNGSAVWNTRTYGRGESSLVMQSDGNLVVYDSAGRATWNSGTNGRL